MPQLQRLSLKAQVYEIIRQKILQQEYALGEKINIDTVADELKISNSPIREALMMLSQDGLIEMIPNNGARVISFSEEGYATAKYRENLIYISLCSSLWCLRPLCQTGNHRAGCPGNGALSGIAAEIL